MRRFLSNVLALAYREATIMRHDKAFIGMVIGQPIIMLILMGGILSTEPWHVPWAVMDRSESVLSRQLVAEIETTGRFEAPQRVVSLAEGRAKLQRGDALALLVIPPELRREADRSRATVELLLDGSDPLTAARVAGIVSGVASRIGVGARLPDRSEKLPELRSTGAIALLGSGIVFGVWPSGSVPGLLLLTLPFVLASLSIGVLISTIARTTAQAVFLTTFSILPSMVLSGVLFPYQLMPSGVREVGAVFPLRWYQIGLRRLVSRGGELADVWFPMLALWLIFGILLLLIARRLRPRLA